MKRTSSALRRSWQAALVALVAGATLATSGTGVAARPSPPPLAGFNYDHGAPLASTGTEPGTVPGSYPGVYTEYDVTFAGADGKPDSGVLMLPVTPPPWPAVELARAAANGWTNEAAALAEHGIASLQLNPAQSGGRTFSPEPSQRTRSLRAIVREQRRGLDYLAAQPGIDATRLGFAGVDDTAQTGMLLVGVDHRLRAAVLVEPVGSEAGLRYYLSSTSLASATPALRRRFLRSAREVDPVRFLPLAHATRLLLENSADSDQRASIETVRRAAGPHAVKRWYPGVHNPDGSGIDRVGFLVKQLVG
jgi:hypothetical protein